MKKRKSIAPPRLAEKLFDWFCSNASVEDLRGDMEELFFLNLQRMSPTRAKIQYWKQVWALVFSYALKKRKQKSAYHTFSSTSFNPSMLKNYFLIATRSLSRHKFFTSINVLGLAIGMSIGLLFIAMLSFILSYDTFHKNKDNIYRVITKTNNVDDNREFASAPADLADKLKENIEGVEQAVKIRRALNSIVRNGNNEIPLRGYYADPSFLKVFTFPLLKGNASNALDKPNSVLITEKAARKIFGSADPFGKIISLDDLGQCEITGVLKDHPKNSHMQFEIIASYSTLIAKEQILADPLSIKKWREERNSYVYLLVRDQTSKTNIERYLQSVSQAYLKNEDFHASFRLQALNDINPGPDLYNQIGPSWDYTSLSIFFVLTLLILIPACFNYANIAISRALKRMKEIGLRKVMGGQKNQIFLQFILETVIITFLALGISYYIFTVIRYEFISLIAGGVDSLDLTIDFKTLVYFVGFALFVGLAAGTVPALYFSKLNPIQALKSKPTGRKAKFSFKKILVVFQFALSLGFIMSVVIVFNQYRQTLNFDFGFNQANILDVELQGTDPDIFRNEFSKLSSVQSLSMSSHVMGTQAASSTFVVKSEEVDSIEVFQMFVDHHYLSNLNLKLLAGHNFEENTLANANQVIVNEEFLKQFKIANAIEAIGQTFLLENKLEINVIGVVKSFHYTSLREPIKSFFFRYDTKEFRVANLKVVSPDIFNTITEMEAVWKTVGGENKFVSKFFDDEIEEAYSFHFAMIKICGFLGLLAISISCLGLLGMVVFTVENRVKEIGVRKVMGASTSSITLLLSKDFSKLMLIAAVIATPLTYLFFDKLYLQMQAYKIPIGPLEIIVSLLLIFVLGFATILSQTMKAAKASPIDSLRNE